MQLSALNVWSSWHERRAQQEREVKENSGKAKAVWDMRQHRGWGNSIGWTNWETRSLYGHTTPVPKAGDELLCEMKSGKLFRLRLVKVEPCYDPSDMWFGTAEDVGYEDDSK
jgi:hypothetical protein